MYQSQNPAYHRQRYLAALQAEARAAEAAAKAAEAEWLATEAIRKEEEILKARLYEIEQRTKHLPTGRPYRPRGSYEWAPAVEPYAPVAEYGNDQAYSDSFSAFDQAHGAYGPPRHHHGAPRPFHSEPHRGPRHHYGPPPGIRRGPYAFGHHHHGPHRLPRTLSAEDYEDIIEEQHLRRGEYLPHYTFGTGVVQPEVAPVHRPAFPTGACGRARAPTVPAGVPAASSVSVNQDAVNALLASLFGGAAPHAPRARAIRPASPVVQARPAAPVGTQQEDVVNDLINSLFGGQVSATPAPRAATRAQAASPPAQSQQDAVNDILSSLFGAQGLPARAPAPVPAPVPIPPASGATANDQQDVANAFMQLMFGAAGQGPKAPASPPVAKAPTRELPSRCPRAQRATRPAVPVSQESAALKAPTCAKQSCPAMANASCAKASCPAQAPNATVAATKESAPAKGAEADIANILQALLGVPVSVSVSTDPTPAAENTPQKAASPQPTKVADSRSLLETLQARYNADSADEIRETAMALISSLTDNQSPRSEPASKGTPAESSIEQLQARHSTEQDQEVRDTIQATINSLKDNIPSSAPVSASASNGKAKATPPESVLSSLEKVRNVEATFQSLEADFSFPSQLDFITSARPLPDFETSTALAHLAFTARNHPVRFYEQSLLALLTDLDFIESHGDPTLRSKRKEVVNAIEQALETLEREITGRYKAKLAKDSVKAGESSSSVNTSRSASPVPEAVEEAGRPAAEPALSFSVPITDTAEEPEEAVASSEAVDEAPAAEPASSNTESVEVKQVEVPEIASDDSLLDASQVTILAPTSEPTVVDEPQVELTKSSEAESPSTPKDIPVSAFDLESEPTSPTQSEEQEDSTESFLLSQAADEPVKPSKQIRKTQIEDLGSDWSEVDA